MHPMKTNSRQSRVVNETKAGGYPGSGTGRWRRWGAVLVALALASSSQAGLKVYYLRHAEGGHNVKKDYENVPRDQWPSYVGNPNVFTPLGLKQVEAITDTLQRYHFDFIAVSPIWRARNTVLPYLKATGQKGEIWPELAEMSQVATEMLAEGKMLPAPRPNVFQGKRIELPADEQPYFLLRPGAEVMFGGSGKDEGQMAADIHEAMEEAVARVKKSWGGTEDSILLVGHGNNGHELLNTFNPVYRQDKRIDLKNTGIWMMEEQPDGSFKLELLNGEPFDPEAAR